MIQIHISIDDQGRMNFASNVEQPPVFFIGVLEQVQQGLMMGPQRMTGNEPPQILVPTGPLPDLKREPKGLSRVK